MDDFGFSLGIPNTPGVNRIGEKNYKNPQQEQKKKKKKDEEEKSNILPIKDEVIISGKVEPGSDPESEKENNPKPHKENRQPPHPGEKIDIKV